MTPFFNTDDARELLRSEAQSWVGTPFVPHAMVKQAGVDCVHLAAGIYLACGAMTEFKPPRYAIDGGQHNSKSQVLAFLDDNLCFEKLADQKPVAGDCVCLWLRGTIHHVGLMLDDQRFIHVLQNRRAEISSLAEPFWSTRVKAVYRPVKGGR